MVHRSGNWVCWKGEQGGNRGLSPWLSFLFLTGVRVFLLPNFRTKV